MARLNLVDNADINTSSSLTAKLREHGRHVAAIHQLSGDREALRNHLSSLTRNNKNVSPAMLRGIALSVTGKPIHSSKKSKGKPTKKDAADHIFHHFHSGVGHQEAAAAKTKSK